MRLAALALLFASLAAQAVEIKLIAIMGSKAMVEVDGARKLMEAGQSASGAKLLNVSADAVAFDVAGRKLTLSMDNRSIKSGPAPEGGKKLVMPNDNGHFYAGLAINGLPLRGVVDTGATVLTLSSAHARAAGVDLSRATTGTAVTAQGTVATRQTTINTLRLGDIVLHNIDALVIDGQFPPIPLIGMNVLQRFTMQREADRLTLIQRY
jgi:aspartyl protease family protein